MQGDNFTYTPSPHPFWHVRSFGRYN